MMLRHTSSVRNAFNMNQSNDALQSRSHSYTFKSTGQSAVLATTKDGISLVHDPVFRALYQDPKHQLHFAETKKQLSFSLITSNRNLQKWITDNEAGARVDYGWVQRSLDRLGKERYLGVTSPGLFRFFNALLICHGHYSNAASKYFGHDIWRRILEAYYTASGDITVKELFLVNGPVDLKDYMRQASLVMTAEAIASRRAQSIVYHEEMRMAERWLLECKNGEQLDKRVVQLKKLNEIYDGGSSKSDSVKSRRRIERIQNDSIRRQKKEAIRLTNLQHYAHQLGREIHNDVSQTMIDAQVAQTVAWTAEYVNDQLPSMLEQVSIENGLDNFT